MVAINAPGQSTPLALVLRLSGTCHTEIAMTAAARGRLMKKTQCQEACSTNHPPRTGPNAVVIAVKPDHVPIRSEEHTSELQSQFHLVCRLLLEKKKKK